MIGPGETADPLGKRHEGRLSLTSSIASFDPSDDERVYHRRERVNAAQRRAHDRIVEAQIHLQRAADELAGEGIIPGLANPVLPGTVEPVNEVGEDVNVLRSSLSTPRVDVTHYQKDDFHERQERDEE